jgi:hypothetical protein
MKNNKIVVFDVDETLGYFTQLGVFCDCLDKYFNNSEYSNNNFNDILDLCPEFIRPKIFHILNYLKEKKISKKCNKVMIYTNNQGPKVWVENLKKYFDNKINYKLFDQIIAAFKVRGKKIELGRTSHDKNIDDFFRCTKMPADVEICFVDDVFHHKMETDSVYYINVKPYQHSLNFSKFLVRFLESKLGYKITNKAKFITDLNSIYKRFNYKGTDKIVTEQEIDEIVGKKMFHHIRHFFYENNNISVKNKKHVKHNKTFKKH